VSIVGGVAVKTLALRRDRDSVVAVKGVVPRGIGFELAGDACEVLSLPVLVHVRIGIEPRGKWRGPGNGAPRASDVRVPSQRGKRQSDSGYRQHRRSHKDLPKASLPRALCRNEQARLHALVLLLGFTMNRMARGQAHDQ